MTATPPRTFRRGAVPTPRHKLAAATPHRPVGVAPLQAAVVPAKLSYWGNDQYGDCVTAEEAFKCAADSPEDFVPDAEVIAWAQKHGVLNGADLLSVMQSMQAGGFSYQQGLLNDGQPVTVDYSNESQLQAAIFAGTVKIGIDANALPSGAGNHQGWFAFGGGGYSNEDHCVSLTGYGSAAYCFGALGVALPAGVDPAKPCYLLFTWSTIGVVDHAWIMGTCGEAWLRQPSTVYVGPNPPTPTPPPPPTPTPTPTPPPPVAGGYDVKLTLQIGGASIPIVGTVTPAAAGALLGFGAAALPPWLLKALRLLCLEAPLLPPPWSQLAQLACSLLPPAQRGRSGGCQH